MVSDLENEQCSLEYKWYVIQVKSGCEEKVHNFILESIDGRGLNDYFKEIFIPYEEAVTLKHGKKVTIRKKLFPGYVFLYANLCDRFLEFVKSIVGVSNFLGNVGRPKVISNDYIDSIRHRLNQGKVSDQFSCRYEVGENVEVRDGLFQNFIGKIDSINEGKNTVKIIISIFGRPTKVEFQLNQIEKVKE